MKKFLYDKAMSAAERVLPPLSKSAFKEKGVRGAPGVAP